MSKSTGPCPTFFRARIAEAKSGDIMGPCMHLGAYSHPGWHLANSIKDVRPDDISESEWNSRIDRLVELVYRDTDSGDRSAWAWFERNLPRCAELVPSGRRAAFLRGAKKAFNLLA